MSTLLVQGPYRFFWYSADRSETPHVHAERDDRTAKYWLDPIHLVRNGGLSTRDMNAVARIITAHRAEWLQRWNDVGG